MVIIRLFKKTRASRARANRKLKNSPGPVAMAWRHLSVSCCHRKSFAVLLWFAITAFNKQLLDEVFVISRIIKVEVCQSMKL